MNAGQTDIEVGTSVKIIGVTGEDKFLNGITGTATHPFAFGCTDADWVGIYTDEEYVEQNRYGDKFNISVKNISLIKD